MPHVLILITIFLMGLIIGSFLNSIIYRLNNGESFLQGRSFCPSCKHQLNWLDLIPLLSFLILRGRCRYCKKPISRQYPLVEFITGVIFILIFWQIKSQHSIFNFSASGGPAEGWQSVVYFIYLLIIFCLLIVIFVSDLKYYIIPDKIIYPAIAVSFIYKLFIIWDFGKWNSSGVFDLGFGILPSIFFLGIILFSHNQWMGLGDFKLALLMGLFLGWPNILIALFLAITMGAIMGLGLIIFKKETLKSKIPFGPFLAAATFIALFWGNNIIQWYSNIFL